MNLVTLLQFGGLVAISFLVAVCALWLVARFERKPQTAPGLFAADMQDAVAFLFEDETVFNATGRAEEMLHMAPVGESDWSRLMSVLSPRFSDIEATLARLPELGQIRLNAQDGSAELVADWKNGLARIELVDRQVTKSSIEIDRPSLGAMERELETLRATAAAAPFLVWRQRADGTITWANSAYLKLSQSGFDDARAPTWPPPRLFTLENSGAAGPATPPLRVTTHIACEAERRWFECFEVPLAEDSLFTAVAADKVVKAEVVLRDFVQTLTKTFAHLTIGLAIFDKQRRLTLFNPALGDLTGLPVEFLASRPTLHAVLDRLREKKMAPEPKDYKSWRRQLEDLEAAAQNGTHEETWSLANGCTYRVVGRPHPDGAVAFLFEDISAEIALTRRFRAELENGQAVLDSMPEAIAVFSPGGALTLSNAAYSKLWDVGPSTILGNFGISDAARTWAEKCSPTPVWGDAREFVSALADGAEWAATVQLRDGRALACRFKRISGGATLAGFTLTQAVTSAAPQEKDVPLFLRADPVSR
jgi:PAS domain-containing protein